MRSRLGASAKAFLARATSVVQTVSVASVPMTPNDSAIGVGAGSAASSNPSDAAAASKV